MKKITKILSLTVVVGSIMAQLALLANNTSSVNVKQEVNEVASDATVELDKSNNGVKADKQAIDANSTTDNYKTVGDIISSDNCTAEDSGQTSTAWMGFTSEFINFEVKKDYVDETQFGEVDIIPSSPNTITSNYLKFPNYIVFNGEKYNVVGIYPSFEYYSGLTGPVTIPASVTDIGYSAFRGCVGLTSLDLSNAKKLNYISENAFSNCTGLTGPLTIPASVTTLDNSAFYNIGCQDLNFLSETPPRDLGGAIFGDNLTTKTLWVPSTQAKTAYDPLAVTNFGLADASYIKVAPKPTSVDIIDVGGPYTINLDETNKPFATVKADVKPDETTNKNVDWSLEDAPAWLKIDANGNIFANDGLKNVTPGKFTFKIKAECQAESTVSTITNDVELNVVYAPIINLAIDDIDAQNIELGENAKALVKCNPIINPTSGVDPNAITWSLVNNNFDWLIINQSTGQISTTKQITDASLTSVNVTVKAETTSTIGGAKFEPIKDFTINFTKPAPISVEILNLNVVEGYTTKVGTNFEIQLDWKVMPDYAKTEVDWEVTGPVGMAIDTNGKITYSPTQIIPETNFIVTCTSKTSATSAKLTSKITVTELKDETFPTWAIVISSVVGGLIVIGATTATTLTIVNNKKIKN